MKVPEKVCKSLINLSYITEIVDEKSITEMIEENPDVVKLIRLNFEN